MINAAAQNDNDTDCGKMANLPQSVEFTMPTPPSTNTLFRNVKGIGRVKTRLYEDFIRMGMAAIRAQKVPPVTGNIIAVIGVERMSLSADIDNRLKALLDTIVMAGIIQDDRYITGLATSWLPAANGLSQIAIRHMPPLDMAECERINAMLLESLQRRKRQKQLAALPDGTACNPDDKNGEEADIEEFRLDYPPGLVGEIAGWITDTARYPQPELAIGAALAIVGTVAGRQFAGPTRSGTHLYALGLAPTGRGKDHALQQISRIMSAAGFGQHIGPSEFISMPSVINFLSRKPLSVCPMDEFGGFMKRINSRRASGFENAISKVIRTLWSSSFSPFITPEWAQKQSEIIYAPAITIYGASTYEQFYSAMEGSSLEDGTRLTVSF